LIKKAADRIKSTWTEEMEFDEDVVISVRDLSTELGYSQSSLAHSRTSVWQIQKGIQEIGIRNPKMDLL
jgi:transcriptional antiterminator